MDKVLFRGAMAALPTPLDGNGQVIVESVAPLIEHLLASGLSGFYVTGGTGEGVALPAAERAKMVEAAIKANAGRGKIVVHIGSIEPKEAIWLAKQAADAGADGVSAVPPDYYFRYNENEMVAYYTKLAGATKLPFLIYAIPKTASMDMCGLMKRLLEVPNIIGAKDTRANYYELWKLKQLNNGNVNVINGPDESLICGLTMGADGGIGSTYNAMPAWFAKLYEFFQAGDFEGARAMQTKINRGIAVLLEHGRGNVIRSVKMALEFQGFKYGPCVFPSFEYNEAEKAALKKALQEVGVID